MDFSLSKYFERKNTFSINIFKNGHININIFCYISIIAMSLCLYDTSNTPNTRSKVLLKPQGYSKHRSSPTRPILGRGTCAMTPSNTKLQYLVRH